MAEAIIKALIGMVIGAVITLVGYALLSVAKIHESIDRLTDEVAKWRKEKSNDRNRA